MGRDEYGLVVFQAEDGLFLEGVECERVLFGGYRVRVDFEWLVLEVVGQRYFVTASVQTFEFVHGDARQFFALSIFFCRVLDIDLDLDIEI